MPFISASEEVTRKSLTTVENKFISKYLPVLEPEAVKVYLYTLYLYQNGISSYTLCDLAESLNMTEERARGYFEYLEEFELVSIVSPSPFEVKILTAENLYGTPKKFKPEKYADFTKNVQNVLSGRMISTNEFREYFTLLEEYGFEQNALIMIINYCVNLKGNDIRFQYIKKVAKSFAAEGVTTAKKVDEKLSAYTSSTPSLIRLFAAAGIRRQPDIEDDRLYKKWTEELGFGEDAIAEAARQFKIKTCEKLDAALEELYKNRKFDAREIADYCKNKSSVYALTLDIAKNLGVYMQNAAPYAENYTGVWCNFGFTFECLKTLSVYCFKNGKKSFEEMDGFVRGLYGGGIVADKSVAGYLEKRNAEDRLLKDILTACGLTRKIIPWDRECLARWRGWNFTDDMLFEAAKLSSGKSNPLAYMNAILSAWKTDGVYSIEKIARTAPAPRDAAEGKDARAQVERHYYNLRHAAEAKAEAALAAATADAVYAGLHRQLNELSVKLAFAEIRDTAEADRLSRRMRQLEAQADSRLAALGIDKGDFTPRYHCPLCNDTGYLKDGKPCACMKKFLAENRL